MPTIFNQTPQNKALVSYLLPAIIYAIDGISVGTM